MSENLQEHQAAIHAAAKDGVIDAEETTTLGNKIFESIFGTRTKTPQTVEPQETRGISEEEKLVESQKLELNKIEVATQVHAASEKTEKDEVEALRKTKLAWQEKTKHDRAYYGQVTVPEPIPQVQYKLLPEEGGREPSQGTKEYRVRLYAFSANRAIQATSSSYVALKDAEKVAQDFARNQQVYTSGGFRDQWNANVDNFQNKWVPEDTATEELIQKAGRKYLRVNKELIRTLQSERYDQDFKLSMARKNYSAACREANDYLEQHALELRTPVIRQP